MTRPHQTHRTLQCSYYTLNDASERRFHPGAFFVLHLAVTHEEHANRTLYPLTSLVTRHMFCPFFLNLSHTYDLVKHAPLQVNEPYVPVRIGANHGSGWRDPSNQISAFQRCTDDPTTRAAQLADADALYDNMRFVNFDPTPENLARWMRQLASHVVEHSHSTRLIAVDWVQDAANKHRSAQVTSIEPLFALGRMSA